MKKLWTLCRRFAAYMVREHLSLYDILLFMTMIKQVEQHEYGDAAITLVVGALIAVLLKDLAGKYATPQATITNVVSQTVASKPDPGFAKRVQDGFR